MSEINYRNATLPDLEPIVAIYNSTIASRMVTADTEPVSVESKMKWFEQHTSTKHPLWVIENENNQIIGWISFQAFYGRPAYNGTAEISIYLDENQRGKGMGKKILAYSLNKCAELGIKTILGFIFVHNEPSLKLFRYFGFEDWGTLPDVAVLDGEEKSLKILGKRI
ncbi:phosphinothricin acetyltransferase [Pedobacter cryoconitis]|uniref:GNAT family N-acetyltransferase n=1 Tax=Pedobacter cryoconitis TaxID=188932 RepID=UPI0016228141|nr:GNAT family N-acetyltransferase [Pedobacter cryoconitis]MBB6269744.1 phosphinothricin acetyltransferase [Pedobacter cryoconitis]